MSIVLELNLILLTVRTLQITTVAIVKMQESYVPVSQTWVKYNTKVLNYKYKYCAKNNKYKYRLQLRILNTITNTEYVFQLQLQILSAQV